MTKKNRQTRLKNSVSHLSTSALTNKNKSQSKKLGVYQEYSSNSGTIPNINQSEMISDTLKYLNGVARRIKSRSHQDQKNFDDKSNSSSEILTCSKIDSLNTIDSLAVYTIYNKTQEVNKHHVRTLSTDVSNSKILKLKHQSSLQDIEVKAATIQIQPKVTFDNHKDKSNLIPIFKFVTGNYGNIDLSPIVVWKFNEQFITSSFLPSYVKTDLLSHLKKQIPKSTPLQINQLLQLRNFYSLPEEVYVASFIAQIDDLIITEDLLLEALDFLELYKLNEC